MRHPSKVQAQRVVLWTALGFVVLQLGLGVAIEGGMWSFCDPYYQYKIVRLRRQWLERQHGDSSEPTRLLTVLGSSRTANGLKGTAFEEEIHATLGERWKIGNVAAPAAGPVMGLICLRRLLAEGIRPDFILVEVTPLFLSLPLEESLSLESARLARADLDCVAECGVPNADELRREWWSSWASPWYAHRFSILSSVAPLFLPYNHQQVFGSKCDRTGWVKIEADPSYSPERVQAIVKVVGTKMVPSLHDFRPAEPSRRALRAILEECRRRDIPAGLIQFPEGSTLRREYRPAARAGIDALMAELQADFHVPLIDARVPDADCGDHVHLFASGADIFSRRLAREMAPLLHRTAESPVGLVHGGNGQ
jgi:hypothetical protein